jgi:hypothetical protein
MVSMAKTIMSVHKLTKLSQPKPNAVTQAATPAKAQMVTKKPAVKTALEAAKLSIHKESPATPKTPVAKAAKTVSKEKKVVAKPVEPKEKKAVAKATQPSVAKVTPKAPAAKVMKSEAPAPQAKTVSKVSPPIAKVQVDARPITKLQVAKLSKAISNSNNTHATNSSGNVTAEASNKTKVIEEAVVSLPMASFALDMPQPVKNKTKTEAHKFPGNATQKAAWERKEKILEKEVEILKKRLDKVNSSSPSTKKVLAATGTFNSHLDGSSAPQIALKPTSKVVAGSQVSEPPMEPIVKEKKPAAAWPTMQSVAAPVALHSAQPGAPPQKDAIAEQQGREEKKSMGSTFTGTPAKKVQSVMALDTSVVHDAVVIESGSDTVHDAASSSQETTTSQTWWEQAGSWVSNFLGKLMHNVGNSVQVVPKKHRQTPPAMASLLDTTQRGFKEDMERTAEATKEEGQHVQDMTSVWGKLEEEDKMQEDRVRSEDDSERQRASTPEAAHTPTKAELKERHGDDMSGFWNTLEQEDSDIEKSVTSENLGEFERLTHVQDALVGTAAKQLQDNKLHTERSPVLKHSDDAFLSKTIHDKWEDLEKKDKVLEKKIHDSPDLQMLQLKHSRRVLR